MTRDRSLPRALGAILTIGVAACGRAGGELTEAGDEGQMPPPAAALSAEPAIGLDQRLERIDADLAVVLENDLDAESEASLLAAEAATDRLLEEEPSALWLASGYLVEARLRQIQALADRIVAELRRGVAEELILEDIAAMQAAVRDLRGHLADAENTDAPTPLDSLLARYGRDRDPRARATASSATTTETTTTTPETEPAPAPATDGGPLGQPVNP